MLLTPLARTPTAKRGAAYKPQLCGDKNKVIFGYVYIVTTITVCDVCNQFSAFRIRTACGFVTVI